MAVANVLVLLTVLFLVGIASVVIQVVYLWARAVAADRIFDRPPQHLASPGRIVPPLLACLVLVPVSILLVLRQAVVSEQLGLLRALSALGLVGVLAAWVLHGVPGHSRNGKYVLLFVSSNFGALLPFGIRPPTKVALLMSGGFALLFLLAGLVIAVLIRPDVPLAARDPSSARALRAWRRVSAIQGPDFLSMLMWVLLALPSLSVIYVLLRWCAKGRASRNAVLYLRSFHQNEAARVFAQVVTPAIYRSMPVSGLVHVTQSAEQLQENVPVLWRANFAVIADAHWQRWVEENISHAMAVVVDVSVNTSSVAWELERAKQILPPERILLLHRRDVPVVAVPRAGVPTLAYDLGTQETAGHARQAVADWLSGALASFDKRLAMPALVARVRRQWPVPLLLVLLVALLILFVIAAFALSGAPASAGGTLL